MHYEILVEGQSELTALSIMLPKILGEYGKLHTWKIHKHQGIGSIPKDLNNVKPTNRSLLGQLPAKINAYSAIKDDNRAILVLLDLDNADMTTMLAELKKLKPEGSQLKIEFCFAIEELEAWFLGDNKAIGKYQPLYDQAQYKSYKQDSICGTWETLARIVNSSALLYPKHDRRVLMEKCMWAKKITPLMDVNSNLSPSFNYLKKCLATLAI